MTASNLIEMPIPATAKRRIGRVMRIPGDGDQRSEVMAITNPK
jgi:hypothetical protein